MKSAAALVQDRSGRKIFNHDISSCTHKDVPGNYLYSGRALGLTKPQDMIQIHPFLRREWDAVTAHYTRIGLPHSRNVIWDVSIDRITEHPEVEESLFFFGPTENRARSDHKRFRVVEHINDKNNFMALASHLHLDVPRTHCFHGKQWLAGIDYFPYPCYLKPAVSVSGKGIFRCETPQQLIQALAYFKEDVPLQVQAEVESGLFLNLQYQATAGGIERLRVTEQVLNGYTHAGNRFPASYEPWASVDAMANWLLEKGIKGIFAFDVAVVQEPAGPRFVPIECNPRFNGASYPSGVASRLGLKEWVALDLVTRHSSVADIDLRGIELDPKAGVGVVLLNWGTVLVGKLGVLLAGTREEQEHLDAELRRRL